MADPSTFLQTLVSGYTMPVTGLLAVYTVIRAIQQFARRDYDGCGRQLIIALFVAAIPPLIDTVATQTLGTYDPPVVDMKFISPDMMDQYLRAGAYLCNLGLGVMRKYYILHAVVAVSAVMAYNKAEKSGDIMSIVWWLVFYTVITGCMF